MKQRMIPSALIIAVFLSWFFQAQRHLLAAAGVKASANTLLLDSGLHLSVRDSFDKDGNLLPSATRFSTGFLAYEDAYFLPILTSPSFNSSDASIKVGFSFGFLFSPSKDPSKDSLTHSIQNVYLAVSGGLAGSSSSLPEANGAANLMGVDDVSQSISLKVPIMAEGYVVPVWYANMTPLTSYSASLVVEEAAGKKNSNKTKRLQLRDHNRAIFWEVSNVGLMEMQDSGVLVIYDTIDRKHIVWQSSKDTLFSNQRLSVGEQLTSSDSSFSARMEKGALVLYINTLQFMHMQQAPYWAVPVQYYDIVGPLNVSEQVLLSSLCPNLPFDSNYSLGNVSVNTSKRTLPPSSAAYAMLDKSLQLNLYPGSCSDSYLSILNKDYSAIPSNGSDHLSFVKLENDGWLRTYSLSVQNSKQAAGNPVWNLYEVHVSGDIIALPILQVSIWDKCAIPNFCGPLGVCSPANTSHCNCPGEQAGVFNASESNDSSKGCYRLTPLPPCREDEHVNGTDYLHLNHTASIFLFSGWSFNYTFGTANNCKQLCSTDCHCNGFFYKLSTSSCFFFTDEMSLLNLTDATGKGPHSQVQVQASDYATFLKIMKFDTNHMIPSTKRSKNIIVATTSVLLLATFFGIGMAVYVLYSRSRKKSRLSAKAKENAKEQHELKDILPLLPTRFSYEELHQATHGFTNLLGAGGCGSVYAGALPDGRKVAVKIIELSVRAQSKQFLAEVATIGRTSHHNIVRLVGFCWEESHRLLVYEYMEGGSLDQWLFARSGADEITASILNWQTRYKVVLGVARGLNYLHEECTEPILHFDIKPQNILLDGAFEAKLADFGMSRLMQRDISVVVTGVRGTPGYIAPEWLSHGTVSKKSDVYSLGMVMLEIMGGRRNVDLELLNNAESTSDQEEWHFVSWAARKCEQGLIMELVDKRLEGTFVEQEVLRVVYSAFWCLQEDPGMRPYVPTLLQWLEGSSAVRQPPFLDAAQARSRSKTCPSRCVNSFGVSSSSVKPPAAGSDSLSRGLKLQAGPSSIEKALQQS